MRLRELPAEFTRVVPTRRLAHALRLRHDAWRISYEYDTADAQALPTLLFAENANGMELRLRIDEWSDLAAAAMP